MDHAHQEVCIVEVSNSKARLGSSSARPLDDKAWRRYVAHRDEEAFAQVVRAHYGLVYSACRRCLGPDAVGIDDAVQETFCKLASNADAIRSNVASWLYRCALNTAREALRRERSRRVRETQWALKQEQSSSAPPTELVDDLDDAIESLSEVERRLIVEHFLVGRSQTELARQLRVTPSAISKRLAAALEKLRRRLARAGVTATVSVLASRLGRVQASAAAPSERVSEVVDAALSAGRGWTDSSASWPQFLKLLAGKIGTAPGVIGLLLVLTTSLAGARWLFRSPTSLASTRTLQATGGQAGDSFGHAIATNGTQLLIGAPLDGSAGRGSGAVYAYHRQGQQWVSSQKILPTNGSGPAFGASLAIDQDIAAIGTSGQFITSEAAPGGLRHRWPASGIASVQLYQFASGHWTSRQILRSGVDGLHDQFGAAIALRGDHLLIGAPYGDKRGENTGVVYAYRRQGDVWRPSEEIAPSIDQPRGGFGRRIVLDKDCAAITASGDGAQAHLAGVVYVFRFVDGRWREFQKLTASDTRAGQLFGEALAMDEGTLAIGAANRAAEPKGSGRVYLFENQNGRWLQSQILSSAEASNGAEFGSHLAMHKDTLLVGARLASFGSTPQTGAAFVFHRGWSGWTLKHILQPTASQPYAAFGDAVALCEDSMIVGCAGGYTKVLSEGQATQLLQQLKSGRALTLPAIRTRPGRAFLFDRP